MAYDSAIVCIYDTCKLIFTFHNDYCSIGGFTIGFATKFRSAKNAKYEYTECEYTECEYTECEYTE
ncbi:hypothetical protein EBZ39_04025 [bacterium]|nr:hypothetical protein [bacterium]